MEFTLAAERDLSSIFDYIAAKRSEAVADGFVGRIVSYCRSLADFPNRGMLRDDILPGLRVVGFERRVTVTFVVTEDAVVVQGVFYGGRDFEMLSKSSPA